MSQKWRLHNLICELPPAPLIAEREAALHSKGDEYGFFYFLYMFFLWVLCGICCQFMNLKGGHRFISAFRAKTPFQKSLTMLNTTKDSKPQDLRKITYIGYFISLILAIMYLIVLPILFIFYNEIYERIFLTVFKAGTASTLSAFIIQLLDSFLNGYLNSSFRTSRKPK